MKKIFLLILLILTVYIAKPFWADPVSEYVDLSFLKPVDEKVETFLNSETVSAAVQYINKTTDKAILFLASKSSGIEVVEGPDKPILTEPKHTQFSIHNIEIGTPKEMVTEALGEPKNRSLNEYRSEWFTYHEGYQNFVMVSFDENELVNGLYTNDDLISSDVGITYGTEKSVVREHLGEPMKEIRKGLNVFILQESEGFDLYKVGDLYAYVFYDIHENNTVTAIQLIDAKLEQKRSSIYANGDALLRHGFEEQLFDLTNAARVRKGLTSLAWDHHVAGTARKHSADMALNDYFSHENQLGKSPFDRMKDDRVQFKMAGENLAYGQSSSIFAHEGLMNSAGHRENILLDNYTHLGVGVAFNGESQPYYTENFLNK